MKLKSKKSALLLSFTSLLLCFAMLAGSTFAWFTDTATTGVNKIQAGNLDIELQMKDAEGNWVNAEGKTLPFLVEGKIPTEGTQILWEPGCTYYTTAVRVVNKGNLAVKFEYVTEALGTTGKLAEVLSPVFKIFDANGKMIDIPEDATDPFGELDILKPGDESPAWVFGYHMSEEAGNEYQNESATGMCLTVVATQATYEKDSIDDQYDANADYTIQVNKDNIQDYLDGKYGPIDGMTLVLAAGDYDKIEFGRATAYEGSNTKYYLGGNESSPDAIKQNIAAHPHGGAGKREYVRSMSNVTLKAADNAAVNINGLVAYSGHVYSTKWYSRDFVADRDMSPTTNTNISYWISQKWNNITFEGLTFTDGVNIEAYSNKDTLIDNVKFDNCKFDITNDADATYCIRLFADGNNCKANNLVVANCDFANGLTAVLTNAMPNVTVTNSTFSGLKGNVISLLMQDVASGVPGYGKITVTGNTFKNLNKDATRVILRMAEVGAGAVFTIKNNTATENINLVNSIKVNSLAEGITYHISENNWGGLTASDPRLDG